MTVPASKLEEYLVPGSTVELRNSDQKRSLANSALPYEDAWGMILRREVEGITAGTRLRYLRILPEADVMIVRDLERESKGEVGYGEGKGGFTRTNLGVRRQALREAIVEVDTSGKRMVVREGNVISSCYQFCDSRL